MCKVDIIIFADIKEKFDSKELGRNFPSARQGHGQMTHLTRESHCV